VSLASIYVCIYFLLAIKANIWYQRGSIFWPVNSAGNQSYGFEFDLFFFFEESGCVEGRFLREFSLGGIAKNVMYSLQGDISDHNNDVDTTFLC
jgi:hypothetical protein